MKKTLLFLMALVMSARFAFAADPTNPDLLAQGLDAKWAADDDKTPPTYDAASKTITFHIDNSNIGWGFWGDGQADQLTAWKTCVVEFEPVDFEWEFVLANWANGRGEISKKAVPAGASRAVMEITEPATNITIQCNTAGVKLTLKAAYLSKYPDFVSTGKVLLSQLNEYADDAIATFTLIATNDGGWGPGWGVGRISDIGYVKDYKDSPFTKGINLIATSPEGSLNTYEYTVGELKALAKVLPADLEAVKAGALTTDPPKEFNKDWKVGDDNSIIRIYRDKDGNITGEEAGLMFNVWVVGKRVSLTFKNAPPTFVLDFESDAIGTKYPAINPDGLSATVEARPAGEGKALHLIHSAWNSYPLFTSVKLPKGYTLGDVEKMSFELYFESIEPAGGQTPNSYKSFNYFFGAPGTEFDGGKATGSANNIVAGTGDNPGKKWLKKQFTPTIGEELLALNEFDFACGLGINEAGNYFLDNITFVLKEKEVEEPQPTTAIYNFDNEEVGKIYNNMQDWGWSDSGTSVTVAEDPLRDGNSLKMKTGNWCSTALFTVKLPEGNTVADISKIQFETYFGDNVTDFQKYKNVELFIAPLDAPVGGNAGTGWIGTNYQKYPVFLKGPACEGEDKSNCFQVADEGVWYPVSVTREQILDPEFNLAIGSEVYPETMPTPEKPNPSYVLTPYVINFKAVNDLSEFLFGIGINIHGSEEDTSKPPVEYYMDNITFVLSSGSGIIQVKPEIRNVYNVNGGIGVNANNEKVSVYGIDGRLIKQSVAGYNSFIPLLRGIYIVKVGTANPVKVLVK